MVATADEIGDAMEVESVSWHRGTTGFVSTATYYNLRIYMGYSPLNVLGTTFAENYVPLSRTLVYSGDATISAEEDEWFTIPLDSPFWYNGSDFFIMEVIWDSGTGNPSCYEFNTPMTPSSLKSPDPNGETGFLSSMRCQFMLDGSQALENGTFASIKVLLGS